MSFYFNDMDQITPLIYLGNSSSASNISKLKELGIRKVLSVIDFGAPLYNNIDKINHKKVRVSDISSQNIIQYFGECLRFMEGNEKILVHCMAGASRSATIVIAYLMWSQKWKYADALSYVQKKRPLVCPNDGFKQQLQIFEKLLANFNYDIDFINFQDIIWYY